MTEDEYSWTLIQVVLHGGLISIFFHALAFGIAAYVFVATYFAWKKGAPLQTVRLACLSFLPLFFASLMIYLCVFHIPTLDGRTHTIWEMARMDSLRGPVESNPEYLEIFRESRANEIARVRLYFYAGWLWTALSLLSIGVAARQFAKRSLGTRAGHCESSSK
jgi:hypothetical protein